MNKIIIIVSCLLANIINLQAQDVDTWPLEMADSCISVNDIATAREFYDLYLKNGGKKVTRLDTFFNTLGKKIESAEQYFKEKKYTKALDILRELPAPYNDAEWKKRCEKIVTAQKEGRAVTIDMANFVNSKNGLCRPFVDGYAAIEIRIDKNPNARSSRDSTYVFDRRLNIVSSYSRKDIENYQDMMLNNNKEYIYLYEEALKYLRGINLQIYDVHKKASRLFIPIETSYIFFNLVDSNGKVLRKNIKLFAGNYLWEDVFWAIYKGNIVVMNTRGEILSEDKWLSKTTRYDHTNSFCPFSNGLSLMSEYGDYCFVNKDMLLAFPQKFEKALPFSEGYAAVCNDGKWGYINTKGKLVIPYMYTLAGMFSEGLAAVQDDEGNIRYINEKNETILILPKNISTSFQKQECVAHIVDSQFSEGFIVVYKDGKSGYMDKYGNTTFDF